MLAVDSVRCDAHFALPNASLSQMPELTSSGIMISAAMILASVMTVMVVDYVLTHASMEL